MAMVLSVEKSVLMSMSELRYILNKLDRKTPIKLCKDNFDPDTFERGELDKMSQKTLVRVFCGGLEAESVEI